jgi:hypothetical protein
MPETDSAEDMKTAANALQDVGLEGFEDRSYTAEKSSAWFWYGQ